jgi:molybdopterin/thiamine biosynthesis adenylyltransferase
VITLDESRYDRQERIWWWDQAALRNSRVLVVGAGALGNEIVKNLVLVGVGTVDVIDMDTIENSNLSRCVFFTAADQGQAKAEVLVRRARELNPDVSLRAIVRPVQTLGSGAIADYDLVIAGLDNREARLWINSVCRRLGRYWIDGAIEGLQGLARVFGPEGACYECTLSEADMAQLSHRRSCALLSPEDLATGRTPTNATTSSIVAGIEVQEAIKFLSGHEELLALTGKVWRLEGETMLTSLMHYTENLDCLAHDRIEEMATMPQPVTSLEDLITWAQTTGEPVVALDLPDDLLVIPACVTCGGDPVVGVRSCLPLGSGRCPSCGTDLPAHARTSFEPGHDWLSVRIDTMHWPESEIVGIRFSDRTLHVPVRNVS